MPFENSTNGSVVYTLDLFADRESLFPDISVCGEIYHDVHHCLLGHLPPFPPSTLNAILDGMRSPPQCSTPTPLDPNPQPSPAKPECNLENVERIYTHPQAFGQCEIFLQTYLRGRERIDVSSTSKAAEIVANDPSGRSVAIASDGASQVHGLDVLGRNIEDKSNNTTRFFVLRKRLDRDVIDKSSRYASINGEQQKSLVSFTVDHKSPGALADALEAFRMEGLNLTSINSRPSRVEPFQYIFFVEFEGSRMLDTKAKVDRAFVELERHTITWRWLGSYKDELR